MLGAIRGVLIITTREDQEACSHLLGHGRQWGSDISYAVQPYRRRTWILAAARFCDGATGDDYMDVGS